MHKTECETGFVTEPTTGVMLQIPGAHVSASTVTRTVFCISCSDAAKQKTLGSCIYSTRVMLYLYTPEEKCLHSSNYFPFQSHCGRVYLVSLLNEMISLKRTAYIESFILAESNSCDEPRFPQQD